MRLPAFTLREYTISGSFFPSNLRFSISIIFLFDLLRCKITKKIGYTQKKRLIFLKMVNFVCARLAQLKKL